jgi:hypothetical protein
MDRIKYIAIVAAIAVATLACNITIDRQIQGVTIGELETFTIEVPPPDSNEVSEVRLEFGAGELNLRQGSDENLVSGTATYNVVEFEPRVRVRGTDVEISQQIEEINIIPIVGDEYENVWDLEFGSYPMILDISAGGYKGDFELGGIPIQELRIAEGAADTRLSFSELNPVEMDSLRYDTGASKAVLTGLANANFRELDFRSGAGDYRLDFSGELQQDAEVSVKSGLSSIVIVVPEGTSASVSFEGGLTNVDRDGGWRMSGSEYVLSGEGPHLDITVEMGAGNLELRTR